MTGTLVDEREAVEDKEATDCAAHGVVEDLVLTENPDIPEFQSTGAFEPLLRDFRRWRGNREAEPDSFLVYVAAELAGIE